MMQSFILHHLFSSSLTVSVVMSVRDLIGRYGMYIAVAFWFSARSLRPGVQESLILLSWIYYISLSLSILLSSTLVSSNPLDAPYICRFIPQVFSLLSLWLGL